MTMTPWYDTREGLKRHLQEGLRGLHEISKARHEAGYGRDERLNEWCLLGMFWMDTCGNFSTITEGAPKDGYPYWKMEGVYKTPDVMDRDETMQFASRWSSEGLGLPPTDARCDRCGSGWDLSNVRDYYQGREQPPRHKACQELLVIEREQKEIKGILDRSEIPYTEMVMIPNQYYPKPIYFGPWFMAETPAGRIKIGWRKHVISISWHDTGLVARGADVVDRPDVTHDETMVHAYGADKAVEALRKLWTKGTEDA